MDCAVGTVRQIHRRLIREGYCIGEYTLRKWIKDGSLHAAFTGNRAYISYQAVVDRLLSEAA